MNEVKQYAERDLMAMDFAGDHYCRHVSAMTREQLHSKSDIAAELGWRDMQIANLKEQLTATTNSLTNAQEALKSAGIEADTVPAGVVELAGRMNQVAAEMSVVEDIHDECVFITNDDYDACPKSVQKIIRSLAVMKIPATDAYLNAVRVEGVEMLVAQKMAEAKRYDSNLSREIAIAATVFANKLRADNAGKDGWIEWSGGDCPVADDAVIEIKLRNGEFINHLCDTRIFIWADRGMGTDIIAYRVIKDGSHE